MNVDEVSDPSIANQGLSPKKRLLDRLSQQHRAPPSCDGHTTKFNAVRHPWLDHVLLRAVPVL